MSLVLVYKQFTKNEHNNSLKIQMKIRSGESLLVG
jgi:hypothetical protein